MSTRRSMASTRAGVIPQQQQQQQQQASYAQQQEQARQLLLQQQAQQQQQKVEDVKPIVDENGVKRQKPEWQLRKVDPETRRLRQNARVKKVVKPKPAIMVLHEMYPDIVYKIDEVASNKTSIYRVHFDLNGKNYSGEGFSKSMAKQNACEQALKALLLEKVAKEQEAEKNEPMETEDTVKKPATDDFPWGKLASFALQKLMDSWMEKPNEAVAINFPKPPAVGPGPYGGHQTFSHPNHVSFSNYSAGGFSNYPVQPVFKPVGPKVPAHPRKKFPENPLEYNPVALFNQTWPNTDPTFDTITGDGKIEHTASLSLEGFRFSATAKSKKEVKLQMAKAIISTLKGIKYPDGFTAQVQHA